jgi:Putative transposase
VEARRERPERHRGRTSTGESTVLRPLQCSNEDGIPLLYSPPGGPCLFADTADGRDNKPRPKPHDDGQYAESSFAGPKAVLAYLSRYTHRVAISNSRLIAMYQTSVTFKWKDYRARGRERQKVMTLAAGEFIRRFLTHVLPSRFHRIRHYGLFANGNRAQAVARARELLGVPAASAEAADADKASTAEPMVLAHPCPCCGGRMRIIETFERGREPRYRPAPMAAVIRIDTS